MPYRRRYQSGKSNAGRQDLPGVCCPDVALGTAVVPVCAIESLQQHSAAHWLDLQGVGWSEMWCDGGERNLVDGPRQAMGFETPDDGLSTRGLGKRAGQSFLEAWIGMLIRA